MSPRELREEREQMAREFQALKALFGGLLLEGGGEADPAELAYYQRKFREAQAAMARRRS